jgi:hypothetical protein
MASKGTQKYGDPGPAKIDGPVSEIRDDFRTWTHEEGTSHSALYSAHTQEHLVPLALASLGLGSCRPLVGLFKSSSTAFQIEMGEVEAQKIAARD